MSTETYT